MSAVVVSGSAGLIGSEAVQFYCERGHLVVGIDNDMRRQFFGADASTTWKRDALVADYPQYTHHHIDIRDRPAIEALFREYGSDIDLVLHAAAQPSHDWAARDPHTDFSVNALGTLTLLEATRQFCPSAAFVFASTNKVYGDRPNELPLVEHETRWDIDAAHPYFEGIDESMSIDATRHSVFGASKVAADVLVQEYGRYFEMKTACFRGGCLTGPNHSGAQLHGFLAYLMRCVVEDIPYTVFGYQGKQVRDNIHSLDYVAAVDQFFRAPAHGPGLQHWGRPVLQLLRPGSDRTVRGGGGQTAPVDLCRHRPRGRPHVVDQQHAPIHGRLPGLGAAVRPPSHARADTPAACHPVGVGS